MAQTSNTHRVKFGDGNVNCGNITGSFNNTTIYKSDEDVQIMRWLSPLEPGNRHDGVRTTRFEGVGDWFLETSEFREWRGGKGGVANPVLFCLGNPGVGKTYISSLVIDRLCDQAREEDLAVAWVYCDSLAQGEQTVINIMGAIMKQLVRRREIPKDLWEAFEDGRRRLLANLVQMLRVAIASLSQVFICFDALDEFLPKGHPELLQSLRDIVRESPRTRLFLTGRHHVMEAIQRYFTMAAVILISPNRDDIRNYVEMRLDRDDEPQAMNKDLRADIIETILDKMSEIFLIASLNIEAILGEVTIGQRRRKLKDIARGNGLSDAYTATLTRLKAQKGNRPQLGLQALMWVLCSQRPLRAQELCHALGVEVGSAELDPENIPALRTLLASCLGLLTVEESSSTVRLVHFTLQEHLSSDATLFHSSHSTIAEVCLTYLNFPSIRNLSPTLNSAPSTMPLLEYASFYWGEHAKRGMTENVKILGLRLFNAYGKHISGQLVESGYDQGLDQVAGFGIIDAIIAIIEMKEEDMNVAGQMGSITLARAVLGGQEAVVRMILDREDADPDHREIEDGRTPLCLAAIAGREAVVKMLLEREGINPNHVDTKYGRTALSWAAIMGHEVVVKMFLDREDIDPDHQDIEAGRTPLALAAASGREAVVKMLLEREDVNPNHADTKYGRTALSWAAMVGHEGVVKMLLDREGVNPDHRDIEAGRTPLLFAAIGGREAVVKVLLEREDVNPNHADTEHGLTPLSWAALMGHDGVVKILLEREDVKPNKPDTKSGRTPLSWAADTGHEGVVKMRLGREDVNPDQPDTEHGQTPLSWAAAKGQEGVVTMLLEREDVNPDQPDTQSGRTPLSWAAIMGHEGVIKILLEREEVNPDEPDTEYGRTPLSWAAVKGQEGVVKMLLGRDDVNPYQPDTKYGMTPLLWGAVKGYEGVVNIFLDREDVDPDQADTEYGRTALSWAAMVGHEGVVKMLLEREDVNPDQADTEYGRAALSWAAESGHEGVVKILLGRDDVNPDQPDTKYGRTPLLWAAVTGHEGVVTMLLEREDVNPNHADIESGLTPLSSADIMGHEGVVKILLERSDVVHPAMPDNRNQTPLSLAASEGHCGVTGTLLEQDDADSDKTYYDGQASLSPSAGPGDEFVVEMGSVFATGQSARLGLGLGRMTFCRPVWSVSQHARQERMQDEDVSHCAIQSRPVFFGTCPTSKNQGQLPRSPTQPRPHHQE